MNRLAASDSSRSGTFVGEVSRAGARLEAYFEAGGWEHVAHAYGYDPTITPTRTRRSARLWIVAQLSDLGAVKSTTATSP